MPEPEDFRVGETLSARKLQLLVLEVRRLRKWHDSSTVQIFQGADGFTAEAVDGQPTFQWFYTTSALGTATASATGTALGSATMTDGTGTARPCKETGTGTTETRVPDQDAADVTIYQPVVTGTNVASGSFVRCAWINGRWEFDMTIRCP